MLTSYTIFLIYCFTYVTMDNMNYPFENLVIIGEYYFVRFDIYIKKSLILFRGFRYEGRYRSPSTKLHGVSSQLAVGFAHTAVETAWINKDKDQCILGLHSQIPDHCKQQSSVRVSQTFRQSYLSHFISSYCLN